MENFGEVIDQFGGPAAFAKAIGIDDSHARAMKTRNSIPAEHWQKVVGAARSLNLDVSYELLATLRAKRFEVAQ